MLDFVGFINDNWQAPTAKKLALLDSFVAQYGYEEMVEDEDGNEIPNPVSKRQFTNAQIVEFICASVNAFRGREAAAAAEYDELALE